MAELEEARSTIQQLKQQQNSKSNIDSNKSRSQRNSTVLWHDHYKFYKHGNNWRCAENRNKSIKCNVKLIEETGELIGEHQHLPNYVHECTEKTKSNLLATVESSLVKNKSCS